MLGCSTLDVVSESTAAIAAALSVHRCGVNVCERWMERRSEMILAFRKQSLVSCNTCDEDWRGFNMTGCKKNPHRRGRAIHRGKVSTLEGDGGIRLT